MSYVFPQHVYDDELVLTGLSSIQFREREICKKNLMPGSVIIFAAKEDEIVGPRGAIRLEGILHTAGIRVDMRLMEDRAGHRSKPSLVELREAFGRVKRINYLTFDLTFKLYPCARSRPFQPNSACDSRSHKHCPLNLDVQA